MTQFLLVLALSFTYITGLCIPLLILMGYALVFWSYAYLAVWVIRWFGECLSTGSYND
jgi:hypothetical protein